MSHLTQAEVKDILNVTPQSLAKHLGLVEDDPSKPDTRSEERRGADLSRQLGLVQMWPPAKANALYCEFAAKFLPALIAKYKTYTTPTNPAVVMINVVSHTPYFVRIQKTPAGSDLVVLQATRIANAENDPTNPDDISQICQFFSTLLALQGKSGIPEDITKKVTQKVGLWRRRYNGQFAGETADRCYQALVGSFQMAAMLPMMRNELERPLYQCGAAGCGRRTNSAGPELKQCSRCKSVVYCGPEHQRQHWPEHKSSCYPAVF